MLTYSHCYTVQNNQLLTQYQTQLNALILQVAKAFYDTLLSHPEAQQYLSEEQVTQRLFQSQQQWLQTVLQPHTPEQQSEFEALQQHIGEVHARIELPIRLMDTASWILKKQFFNHLVLNANAAEEKTLYGVVSDIIDFATYLINQSYFFQESEYSKQSQTLALTYASSDLAIEIIKIKSELHEWLIELLINDTANSLKTHPLIETNFYLWLEHRLILLDNNFQYTTKVMSAKQALFDWYNQLLADPNPAETFKNQRAELKRLIKKLSYTLQLLSDEVAGINNHKDPLTTLQNRRLLDAVMIKEHHLAREGKSNYCLMMIDIDHFKHVNDTYGHDVGDIVLREVAARIKASLRITDLAFRYGGEEFLIVMPCSKQQKAKDIKPIAEKIRAEASTSPIQASEHLKLSITISIGVACYDRHPDYLHTIKEADQALYQAKKTGRNKVVIFEG